MNWMMRRRGTIRLAQLGVASALAVALAGSRSPAQSDPTTTQPPEVSTLQPASTTTTVAVPQTPREYVAYAISAIEHYAYKRSQVDWPSIRAKAEAATAQATTYAETYDAITAMVRALNDKHSSFTRPIVAVKQTDAKVDSFGFLAAWPSRRVVTVAAGGPAARAGLKVGDRIDKIDGKAPLHSGGAIAMRRNKEGQLPKSITITWARPGNTRPITATISVGEVTLISIPQSVPVPTIPGVSAQALGRLGYLDVPGIVADATAQATYATQVQDVIRDLDSATVRCGWIVDLRRNRGGYIHAMLAGLGPLVEGGSTGASIGGKAGADRSVETWRYLDGTSFTGTHQEVSAQTKYLLANPAVPVAVLTSRLTASAGEAVTVAFRGRPLTRSFGEPTYGIPTYTVRVRMADGAFLDLTQAVDVDRTGQTYEGPIAPDEPVAIDWTTVGTADDPVLRAAGAWLAAQPSCAA